MTANDYANIQRMIDATIAHACGLTDSVPESDDIALMSDVEVAIRDLQSEIDSKVSDVQHDVNRLEDTISNMEGEL